MVVVGLFEAENLCALLVEGSFFDQVVDSAAGREIRIQLKEGFGPESLSSEMAVDECFDLRIADLDEAARICAVVSDQALPEIEYVQTVFPALIDGGRVQVGRAKDGEQL